MLDVTYSVGSKTGILTVPAKGHFRTRALSRTARFYETDSKGSWKCEDFADLTPSLCDKLPPWTTDPETYASKALSIEHPPRTAEKYKGWGLWSDLAGG